MNFDKYLFRCSSLGHLMSEAQGKSNYDKWVGAHAKYTLVLNNPPKQFNKDNTENKLYHKWQANLESARLSERVAFNERDLVTLSEGAKTHLMDIYISEKLGRKTDISNKYITKGLAVEEDSITIYSRIKKTFFKKNETHLVNAYIKGTPDMFVGETIGSAIRIIDTKSSWDMYTFYRTFIKALNPLYFWQGIGYMWLTGARYFDLAYCLVNTPEPLIEAEKRNIWYKLGQPDLDNGNFIDACAAIEKAMLYDDVPLHERLLEYSFELDEAFIELAKKKIEAGRVYLNQLHIDLNNKFYTLTK
jgi:hypothetical protein